VLDDPLLFESDSMPPVVEPDRQSYAIVVLGDFNPSIFQPLWFSANDLLPEEETREAEISIIHKAIASFSVGKLQIQVDESRLGLTTVESSQGPILRDLAIGTLSILEHTPLKAIGLNRDMVFQYESEEAWHSVGHRLAPKADWECVLDQPGMMQLAVRGTRKDASADQINVRVQPSENKGILIAVNQHYQLETDERPDVRDRHKEALRVLRDDWHSFTNYAREAALALLKIDSPNQNSSQNP
jgi:hypothetical protein